MALRYNRKIRPDILPISEIPPLTSEYFDRLRGLLAAHLNAAHGWRITETGDGQLEAINATLTCKVQFRLDSDMGADGVRFQYVQTALTSMNHRRAEADAAEVATTQGFQKTFAWIGAAVIGVPCFIISMILASVVRSASVSMRMVLVITGVGLLVGWLGGGLIGYMMGSGLGGQIRQQKAKMTFDDEVDLGVARADWEQFVDAAIGPIEEFARTVESRPSAATIV